MATTVLKVTSDLKLIIAGARVVKGDAEENIAALLKFTVPMLVRARVLVIV